MEKRNSTALKRRMEGRWLSAFLALAPALETAVNKLGKNVSCPIDGGTDGFRLFRDANTTGGGVKQAWRVIPEGIDMLMWVNDWSFTKTYDELEAFLGGRIVDTKPIRTPKTQIQDDSKLRLWLNQIWGDALPLNDLRSYPARAYFERRRLRTAAMLADDLRFHPSLNYVGADGKTLGQYGAILGLVRNNAGEPVSIHRTFITKSGLKVEFSDSKNKSRKLTPAVNRESRGRQIRVNPVKGTVMGVAEGLETALAVTLMTQLPVWPTLSTTMMQSFLPPEWVEKVLIFVDKDRNQAGEVAANTLAEKLSLLGLDVQLILPSIPMLESDSKGVDWADQLMRDPSGFGQIGNVLRDRPRQTA
ncbi:hypothetical protein AU15_19675 [Marinobacter salarius]|uniref:Uncharacterized protein n=1 Tax=Marinobacter salarius TaxID=1420917 RepID=W5YUB0_9GAMM|nr:hypothetical protein AU15_19675 [Marinobacter salarius]